MAKSSPIPQWAADLTAEVCREYRRAAPKMTWYNTEQEFGSGRTTYPRRMYSFITREYTRKGGGIHISAGTNADYQKLLVLHELAHWITVRNKNQGHNARFWNLAFELYERYGVNPEMFKHEFNYKKGAAVAFAKRSKPKE